MIQKGIYRHFKGGIYEVVENAVHTETGNSLVLYRAVDRPSLAKCYCKDCWHNKDGCLCKRNHGDDWFCGDAEPLSAEEV